MYAGSGRRFVACFDVTPANLHKTISPFPSGLFHFSFCRQFNTDRLKSEAATVSDALHSKTFLLSRRLHLDVIRPTFAQNNLGRWGWSLLSPADWRRFEIMQYWVSVQLQGVKSFFFIVFILNAAKLFFSCLYTISEERQTVAAG